VKHVARAIALASVLLGVYLVSRTYVLENRYASSMPRERDLPAGRTVEALVSHGTHVFVTDIEARALDASRTYVPFGWPFVVLGVLLAASSRERRPLGSPPPESDTPWSARR
jgi:hypothetical protein